MKINKLILITILLLAAYASGAGQLRITYPAGGEKLFAGSDVQITWEGVEAADTVELYFSADNGKSWSNITKSASGNEYIWQNIPYYISDGCMIKAVKIRPPTEIPQWEWVNLIEDSGLCNSMTLNNHGGATTIGNIGDLFVFCFGNDGELLWQKKHERHFRYYGHDILQRSDGGYLAAGYTSVLNSVSPKRRMFLLYLDSTGNIEKEIFLIGPHEEYCLDLDITTSGDIIVGGTLLTPVSQFRIYKLKPDGEIIWDVSFKKGTLNSIWTIDATTDGGCIAAGMASEDFWIIKVGADGKLQWDKTLTGDGHDVVGWGSRPLSIIQTTDGGYLVAGNSSMTYGDFSFIDRNNQGAFAIKLDSKGEIEWKKAYKKSSTVFSVSKTLDGGYVLGGCIFDDSYNGDVWVCKIDSMGDPIWDQKLDSAYRDRLAIIKQLGNGDYIMAGNCDDGFSQNYPTVFKLSHDLPDLIDSVSFSIFPPPLQVLKDTVDFGKVSIKRSKDSLVKEIAVNTTETEIIIDSIYISGKDSPYAVEDIPGDLKLAKGDTLALNISFAPRFLQDNVDSLIIEYENMPGPVKLFLLGYGEFEQNVIELSMPDTVVRVNDEICLPVYAELIEGYSENVNWTMQISMPYDVLIVEENAKYVEDKLVVTLSGAMELKPGKNKLGSICGRVLFPRELNNTVSFKEVSWYDPVTDMNVINGSLQISRESLCMPDLRHVGYFTPLNLSVQPNPSSETINLSIFSEPETPLTILLHDSQGRCLYSRSVTTTGKDNISIETTSLSNGLYHLQVKSPYEVKTIPVGVVK